MGITPSKFLVNLNSAFSRLMLKSILLPPDPYSITSFTFLGRSFHGRRPSKPTSPDDPRPWSALYRALLEARTPLDRAVCDAASEPMLVESCRQTALAVYNDRLNRARDRLRWCPGAPVPDALAHTEDPDLEAMLLRRAEEELCQGSR